MSQKSVAHLDEYALPRQMDQVMVPNFVAIFLILSYYAVCIVAGQQCSKHWYLRLFFGELFLQWVCFSVFGIGFFEGEHTTNRVKVQSPQNLHFCHSSASNNFRYSPTCSIGQSVPNRLLYSFSRCLLDVSLKFLDVYWIVFFKMTKLFTLTIYLRQCFVLISRISALFNSFHN